MAVTVAAVEAATVPACAVPEPDAWPAATVMLAGTVNAELLLVSVTTAPPAGAAAVSNTVTVALPPLVTDDGLTDTEDSAAVAGGVDVPPFHSVTSL